MSSLGLPHKAAEFKVVLNIGSASRHQGLSLRYGRSSYHQQYLAKPDSRPYCSAMPTQVELDALKGSNHKLRKQVRDNYDWSISHPCSDPTTPQFRSAPEGFKQQRHQR